MNLQDFLTIDYIKTFMGTVIVTMLIIQFLKELPFIKKIPTRYFTFVIAFLNIFICSILTNTFTIANIYLMVINAVLVTFTATGGYDFTIKKVSIKDKEIPPKNINPTNSTNIKPLD